MEASLIVEGSMEQKTQQFARAIEVYAKLESYDPRVFKQALSKKKIVQPMQNAAERLDHLQQLKEGASETVKNFLEELSTINKKEIKKLQAHANLAKVEEIRHFLLGLPYGVIVPYIVVATKDSPTSLNAALVLPSKYTEEEPNPLEKLLLGAGETANLEIDEFQGYLCVEYSEVEVSEKKSLVSYAQSLSDKVKTRVPKQYRDILRLLPTFVIEDRSHFHKRSYAGQEETSPEQNELKLVNYYASLQKRMGKRTKAQQLYMNALLTIANRGHPHEPNRPFESNKQVKEEFALLHGKDLTSNMNFFENLKRLIETGLLKRVSKGVYRTI